VTFRPTITGYSEEEVQRRIDELIKRNPKLVVVTAPKRVKDGRMFIATKWMAVLEERG
jgi:hypothetical protein